MGHRTYLMLIFLIELPWNGNIFQIDAASSASVSAQLLTWSVDLSHCPVLAVNHLSAIM